MIRVMFVFMLLFTCAIPISQAEETDSISSERYAMVGPLDAIDVNNYSIVVGDVQIPLATDVRVRDPKGGYMALGQMQPGMRVGIVSDADARGTANLVSEIHVLSSSYARHGSEY